MAPAMRSADLLLPASLSSSLQLEVTVGAPETRTDRAATLIALSAIGTSSWLLVNAVYASAGWLGATAPEGYTIFSDLDLAIEVTNALPITLVLCAHPWLSGRLMLVSGGCICLACFGALFALLAYDAKLPSTSIGLLAAGSIAGGAASTSMVCFFGFAHMIAGSSGTVAMSIGIGLSGLLAQVGHAQLPSA